MDEEKGIEKVLNDLNEEMGAFKIRYNEPGLTEIFNKNANLVAVTVLAILNQKMQIKLRSKAKLVARIAIRRTIAKKMQVKVVLQLQINPPEVAIIVGQKVFVLWATKQRMVQKEAVVAEKARHLVHLVQTVRCKV